MKTIKYNPVFGTHIRDACALAVKLARSENARVEFTFNEAKLVATPKSSATTLQKDFDEYQAKESERYRNSKAGKAAAAERKRLVARRQKTVDRIEAHLAGIISGGMDRLLRELANYASAADDVAVKKNLLGVATALRAAGYRNYYGVGKGADWFNTRERMGPYIVGQAINCMEIGMAPHPVLIDFVDGYFNLRP